MSLPSLTAPSFFTLLCAHFLFHFLATSSLPSETFSFCVTFFATHPDTSEYTLLSQIFFPHTVLYSLLGGDLQTSSGALDEGGLDDNMDWEEEREMERLACEGDDFIPPKIMVSD